MRAETASAFVRDILLDVEKSGVEVLLPRLVTALEQQVANPDETNQTAVAKIRDEVRAGLEKSRFNNASPLEAEMIREMEIGQFLGNRLRKNIEDAFSVNEITPAAALSKIKTISDRIVRFYEESKQFISSSEYFEIYPDELSAGEFEVAVVIPRRAVDNELDKFGSELKRINRIISVFGEMATGSREPIKIRAISSSDLTVFLDSAPAVAALVATAIERTATLYEKLLIIIKMHRDLKASDVPATVTDSLKAHIDDALSNGLAEIAKSFEKSHIAKIENSRKSEIRTELKMALNEIAQRLDNGYYLMFEENLRKPKTEKRLANHLTQ